MQSTSSCRKTLSLIGALGVTAAALLSTTGCAGRSGVFALPTPASAGSKTVFHGNIHGGQQPVSGSTIQLYETGTNGTGSASLPLLSPPAMTDGNGNFNIATYSCDYGSLVYLTATGGNPGLSAPANNPALVLMAVLGTCNYPNAGGSGTYYTMNPNLFVFVDEVTTVAAIYALSPFMVDYTHIGSSGAGYGITNAFQTAAMLADIGAGVSPGPSLPSAVTYDPNTGFPRLINTLANLLAGCVNTNGAGNACTGLFSSTTANGHIPADTSAAMLSIARNPGLNVTALFNQTAAFAPFAPALTIAPKDWTLALNYTGLGLNIPKSIAFDGTGNLWIVSQGTTFVTELYAAINPGGYPAGYSSQFPAGLLGPQSIAVDNSGQIWIANTAGNSVVQLDNYGNILSGNGLTGGGLNAPISIAIDPNGNAWVANFNGNSLTQFLANGSPSSFSPVTQGFTSYLPVSLPVAVAVDGNSNVYVSNSGLSTYGLQGMTLEYSQNGIPEGCVPSSSLLAGPAGLAIDAYNNIWIAGSEIAGIQAYASNGCGNSGFGTAPVTGGGLNTPTSVAIDGSNNIWAANTVSAGSISEVAAGTVQLNAGSAAVLSPTAGFGSLNTPNAIAVDPSGNVWTANAGDNTVTEFVGIATPTVTPIVAALP